MKERDMPKQAVAPDNRPVMFAWMKVRKCFGVREVAGEKGSESRLMETEDRKGTRKIMGQEP